MAAPAFASRSAGADGGTCGSRRNDPARPACSRLVHMVGSTEALALIPRPLLGSPGRAKWLLQPAAPIVCKSAFPCQATAMIAAVPQRRRVGIKDVATAAGVSATTVSHALNGKGRLPPGTREKVHPIAQELGYRPNATARHLAGGKTGVLGLAVSQGAGTPDTLSDFAYFMQLMTAATAAAFEHGYALVLTPVQPEGSRWLNVAIDGAIVT